MLGAHGENDVMFVKPMALMAREMPSCKLVIMKDRGHMTAIEDPTRTGDELLRFLADLRRLR